MNYKNKHILNLFMFITIVFMILFTILPRMMRLQNHIRNLVALVYKCSRSEYELMHTEVLLVLLKPIIRPLEEVINYKHITDFGYEK